MIRIARTRNKDDVGNLATDFPTRRYHGNILSALPDKIKTNPTWSSHEWQLPENNVQLRNTILTSELALVNIGVSISYIYVKA